MTRHSRSEPPPAGTARLGRARHRQPTERDWELTRLKAATFAVAGLLLLGVVLAVTAGKDEALDSDPVRPTRSTLVPTTSTTPSTTTTPAVTTTQDPAPAPETNQQPPSEEPASGAPAVGVSCPNPGSFAVTADLRPVVCTASAAGTTWQPVI